MITSSMRSQPGIVSLNFDLANGVGPGIEKWRGSRYYLAIAYVLGGAVGPGACRTLFADFRGGAICLFRTHFLGWSGRFFHGCDGSFPRTRAPVPATGSGEPLGTDAELSGDTKTDPPGDTKTDPLLDTC